MAREAAKIFIQRNRGNIVNISSTAGLRGAPNGTAYYASKFALRGMTECWRAELRKHNIRVILVNPSEVVTNFFQHGGSAAERKRDETARRRDRVRGKGGAGNGRPRIYSRAVGVRHEPERLTASIRISCSICPCRPGNPSPPGPESDRARRRPADCGAQK